MQLLNRTFTTRRVSPEGTFCGLNFSEYATIGEEIRCRCRIILGQCPRLFPVVSGSHIVSYLLTPAVIRATTEFRDWLVFTDRRRSTLFSVVHSALVYQQGISLCRSSSFHLFSINWLIRSPVAIDSNESHSPSPPLPFTFFIIVTWWDEPGEIESYLDN